MGAMTPKTKAPTRAVVYRRISQDATGEAAGVERQRQDCLRACAERGWTVVADLEDNDISASRYSRKIRPAYAEALRIIETGGADTLVAWHLDRLWRQPKELEHLIDLAEHKNVTVATLYGDTDLTNGDGRFVARILVGVAAKSSDDLSRRILRKMEANAASGQPHGGHRAFGFEPGNVEVREDEATLIREAAQDVAAGETLKAIASRWNAAGVATPTGHAWAGSTVRNMLISPRLAGLRSHRGEIVGPGTWPAILDRATWEALKATLTDAGRRAANPPRHTLLATFVRCGVCGASMVRNQSKRVVTWRCTKRPGSRGCGRVGIAAKPFEDLITDKLLLRLEGPALAQAMVPSPKASPAADDLAALDARMIELAQMFSGGEIGRAEWMAARTDLERRQTAARAVLHRSRDTVALTALAGGTGPIRDQWASLSLDRQRAILAAVVDRITVRPATRSGPVFDPSRVTITWRV